MKEKTIKIMIVDDHLILINGIKSLLENVKNIIVVAEAGNGKEALEVLKTKDVDVVLLDIEMPVMNGLEAARIITEEYPGTNILTLTSFGEKAIVKKMMEAGAKGYVLKNITKDILIEAIITVSKGEEYLSSETELTLLKTKTEEIISSPKRNTSADILTKRETEILRLIAEGFSNNEIAPKLFISEKTVKAHRENIMGKLKVHNVAGLVRFAIENGLTD